MKILAFSFLYLKVLAWNVKIVLHAYLEDIYGEKY